MVALFNDVLRNSQVSRRNAKRAVLLEMVAILKLWRRRLREKDELAKLGPRELQDIGLTTSDVDVALSKPFWRA